MEYFAGLDVSMEEKHICVLDREGAASVTSELVAEMGSQNNAAARIVGRISLFLESIVSDERLAELHREASRLSRQVKAIEEKIGLDDQADRLSSVLNGVSANISTYVSALGGEFGAFPTRFDLNRLTLVFDRPDRPIYMNQTGGGENHLSYHLGALLSLHRFAAKGTRWDFQLKLSDIQIQQSFWS